MTVFRSSCGSLSMLVCAGKTRMGPPRLSRPPDRNTGLSRSRGTMSTARTPSPGLLDTVTKNRHETLFDFSLNTDETVGNRKQPVPPAPVSPLDRSTTGLTNIQTLKLLTAWTNMGGPSVSRWRKVNLLCPFTNTQVG